MLLIQISIIHCRCAHSRNIIWKCETYWGKRNEWKKIRLKPTRLFKVVNGFNQPLLLLSHTHTHPAKSMAKSIFMCVSTSCIIPTNIQSGIQPADDIDRRREIKIWLKFNQIVAYVFLFDEICMPLGIHFMCCELNTCAILQPQYICSVKSIQNLSYVDAMAKVMVERDQLVSKRQRSRWHYAQ